MRYLLVAILLVATVCASLPGNTAVSIALTARPVGGQEASYPIDYPVQVLDAGTLYAMEAERRDYYLVSYRFHDNTVHAVRMPKVSGDHRLARVNDGQVQVLIGFEIDFEEGSVLLDSKRDYSVARRDGDFLVLDLGADSRPATARIRSDHCSVSRVLSSPSTNREEPDERQSQEISAERLAAFLEDHPPVTEPVQVLNPTKAICILESSESSATGFLLSMDDRIYCITNHHVISSGEEFEIRTTDGRRFTPLFFEVARNRDLARILIKETPPAFLKTGAAVVGDQVDIFGNRSGIGVVRLDSGKVVGTAPGVVELKADFVSGNSGSPVVRDDGAVVGVATFALTVRSESGAGLPMNFGRPKVRRFATRIDDAIDWVAFDPPSFGHWVGAMMSYERFIGEIAGLSRIYSSDLFATYPDEGVTDPLLKAWIRQTNGATHSFVQLLGSRGPAAVQDITIKRKTQLRRLAGILKQKERQMNARLSGLPEFGYFVDQREQLANMYDVVDMGMDTVIDSFNADWFTLVR